jgi:hypothetical protein
LVLRAIEAVLTQFETLKKARRKAGGNGNLHK